MAALLIRRRRPIGEPPPAPDFPPGVTLFHGTGGAGRIALALTELGFTLDDATQAVLDTGLAPGAIDAIDVGRPFDRVVLGSHLVNLPEDSSRRAFLRLALRHLAPGGDLLVEHHPLDWATTADATPATPGGSQPGMVDVRRDPPFVSAVSVYDVGGRVVRQPFTARVLSDEELAAELASTGLRIVRRLDLTWIEATPRNA